MAFIHTRTLQKPWTKLTIVSLHLARLLWNWQKTSIGLAQMCGMPTWCIREQMKSADLARRALELRIVQAQTCAWHRASHPFARSGKLVRVSVSAWMAQHPTTALIYWMRHDRRYSCSESVEIPQLCQLKRHSGWQHEVVL